MSFIIHVRHRTLAGMISNYIQFSQVLVLMDQLDDDGKPIRFQVKFVTANRKLKTGGEIIEIIGGRKCVGKRGGDVVFDTRQSLPNHSTITRAPNHSSNSTRNILLPNGGMRKLHIRLIIEFNKQKVFF